MIICLNCQHQEISGALFCSECGAQLGQAQLVSTRAIGQTPSNRLKGKVSSMDNGTAAHSTPDPRECRITLGLLDTGQQIALSGRLEYTLGRVAEGQPILPDVDFSSYGAYSHGVSRLHAALKVANDLVMVVDLGSSNGTRVNGQKITPNIDYPINNGDILALGKLKLQVQVQR